MWFRSLIDAFKSHSSRTFRRQSTWLAPRFSARRINIEPLEDRRVLSFTAAVDYPVGEYPTAIVSADFNADGRLDLATSNYSISNVSVMLGNADGTFQATQTSATGSGPLSLAVGDFNGDGKLDLATANSGDVSLLLGNGNGTFQAPTSIYIGSSPSSVAVGDFNNDGKLDLGVTSNFYYPGYPSYYGGAPAYYTGHANVLLGNGGGSFAAPNTTWLGYGGHTSATLADFNGDGKLDFASTSSEYGNVVVLLGNGTGVLGAPNYFSSSYGSRAMTAGDVNADGKLDLLTANASSSTVGVLLGNGTGSFGASQFYAGSYPFSVALGDFNGDGKADLVTTNQSNSTVSVLLGTGTGTFRPPVAAPTGISPYDLVIGDFNSDGRLDAATANFFDNGVSVLLNDGIWPATNMPALTIGSLPGVTEGNIGTTQAVFTVSLSSAYSEPITVPYTTTDGTATVASGDYQAKSGTLTFAPGQITQTITVLVNGDRLAESTETFSVTLSNLTNAFLANAVGTEAILDDEPIVSISNFASGPEGNIGTTPFLFTVTLSAPSDVPVKVGFATSNLPYEWAAFSEATADVDYQTTSGTLTFAPGETSKPITVLVNGDRIPGEYSEYFFVNLSSPEGAGLAASQTWGEIQDDEPFVGFGQASVTEGNSGTTPMVFTATLSAAYDAPVTVGYTTYDGSATAGIDYTATSGTLTFAPGETSKTVTVLVNGDTVYEGDDYFNLSIVESNSATFDYYYGYAVGTIVDDDPNTPQISISDVTKKEGNAGKTAFVFTMDLSAATSSRVTVNYATANGSAAANSDFQAASGTITFAPGQTSKTITVQVKGDTTAESDETFAVNLSGANGATIVDSQGLGTIVDDDVPQIRISDVSKKESNSGTTSFVFTVSLSSPAESRVTVDYATANGSAKKGDDDYAAKNGKLTFSPGQTSKTVTVTVYGDKKNESDESFFLNLGNAKGALIDDGQGLATILNDDDARRGDRWNMLSWAAIDDAIDDFLSMGRRRRGR